MTVQAYLQFGDNVTELYNKQYTVVTYKNKVSRAYNAFNPQSNAKCNDIEVSVIAPGKKDLTLFDWYINNGQLSGRLMFQIMDIHHTFQTVERCVKFYDAQCVAIKDSYDIDNKRRRIITLTFTPEKMKVEEQEFGRSELHLYSDKVDHSTDDDINMKKYNDNFDF